MTDAEVLDFPSNLRRCDPDDGGCGTLFAFDLLSCPHCQRERAADPAPDDAGTETEQRQTRIQQRSIQDVQLPEKDTEATDK